MAGLITRPERIPPTLPELVAFNHKILQDLQEQLAQHVSAAVSQLHVQVGHCLPLLHALHIYATLTCSTLSLKPLVSDTDMASLSTVGHSMQKLSGSMTRCVALQVVTLQGLLERLPGAATHALSEHELQEAAAERAALDAPFLARHEDLSRQFLLHKRGLHPSLAHPNR